MKNKFSRQMIAAAISVLAGLASIFLVDISAEQQAEIANHIESILGSVAVLYGIILGIFRKITNSPLVGFFKKRVE